LKFNLSNKGASLTGALFFAVVFMPTECAADDRQSGTYTAEIGVSTLSFNYAELNDAGATLDKELGSIPGLSFRLAQRQSDWETDLLASYHYGRVDYIGQTQSGVPYNTRTDEKVGDFALRLGRWFEGSYPVMPYAGFGYRRWDRDILGGGGYFESYYWKYVWLGAKFVAYQRAATNLMLDIGWVRPLDPVLDVYGAFNNPTLSPGSRSGLRLMLTSRLMLVENTALILEPYYEYWQLGRSPSVSSGGSTIYEPESKTRNFGMNMRLGMMF
jgi:hypothetical protein